MENQSATVAVPEHAAPPPAAAALPEVLPVTAAGVDGKVENGGAHGGVAAGAGSGGGGGVEASSGKRKRGRPRKHPVEGLPELTVVTPGSSATPAKRGRGRPRGSGKWQTMAAALVSSKAGLAGYISGSNFTPHMLQVEAGENIVQKIWSFSQSNTDSMCIMSATGTISSVEIRPPVSRNILRYEGNFTILNLNGSHTINEKWGQNAKHCVLTVEFANNDGQVYGGFVGGSLVAAAPTLLIVGTFKQNLREQLSLKRRLDPMRPNRATTVPVPFLMPSTNGKLPDTLQANGIATVPAVPIRALPIHEVPAPPVNEVVMNGPNANHASTQQPSD